MAKTTAEAAATIAELLMDFTETEIFAMLADQQDGLLEPEYVAQLWNELSRASCRKA